MGQTSGSNLILQWEIRGKGFIPPGPPCGVRPSRHQKVGSCQGPFSSIWFQLPCVFRLF